MFRRATSDIGRLQSATGCDVHHWWFAVGLVATLASSDALADEEPRYQVSIRFEKGPQKLSTFELERALNPLLLELRRHGVNAGAVDDSAYELERYYRTRGFLSTEVTARAEQDGTRFVIYFEIDEGAVALLDSLEFRGNEAIESVSLSRCFSWRRIGLLGFRRTVYTPDDARQGVQCVLARYQDEGYLLARVEHVVVELPQNKYRVEVEVDEGSRIWLRAAPALSGAEAFSLAELEAALQLEPPVVYTPRLPVVLRGKLIDFYRNNGYRFVEVRTSRRIDPQSAEAVVDFHIDEGPLSRIVALKIEGNEKTRDWVIEERMKLRVGDLYNEELVRDSHKSLFKSGLFREVRIDTSRLEGAEDQLSLDVQVQEAARYRASLLVGAGTYEIVRGGVIVEDVNVMGTGHVVRTSGTVSLRSEEAAIEYINPLFFSERVTHRAKAFYERREHPSFESAAFGGETGVNYAVTEDFHVSGTYRLKRSDTDDEDTDLPPELVQDLRISAIQFAALVDRRDSVIDPHSGWMSRMTFEVGDNTIGSQLDYVRPIGLVAWIVPIWESLHLVIAARGGVVIAFDDEEAIPVQERFFVGGESTIRSFEQDRAGPEVDNTPIGGEAFTLYNAEFRFPIWDLLGGAVFYDIGTVNEQYEDIGSGRYFQSIGIGVRLRTPVGPFRLDVGFNPEPVGREDIAEVQFALGYPF